MPVRIRLSPRLFEAAPNLKTSISVSERELLRFNFFFAVVVCHEVAHGVERLSLLRFLRSQRYQPNEAIVHHKETYLLDNQKVKAGFMFESMFTEGCVDPRIECDFSVHLIPTPWPNDFDSPRPGRRMPEWIVNLVQLLVFWTAIEGDEFPDFLLHGVDREGNRVSSVGKALEAIEK